jgi:hypothetical protein
MLTGWYNEPEFMGAFYNHWPRSKEMVLERIESALGPEKGLYIVTRRADGEPLARQDSSIPTPPTTRRCSMASRFIIRSIMPIAGRGSGPNPPACW